MNLLNVLLIGLLATYFLTFMLHELHGPADIFGRFRYWIGIRPDEHSRPQPTNWRAEAVMCFYCLSMWIGFLVCLLLGLTWLLGRVEIGAFFLLPFAFAGGASFLKKWTG